jgi:hypothetical protein
MGYFVNTSPFFSVMTMGPHFIPPGGIHWSGDRFTYSSHLFKDAIEIEGELVRNTSDFPVKMLLTYRGQNIYGQYAVYYDFDTNRLDVPAFLPDHIRSVVFHGKTELPDKDIRLFYLLNPVTRGSVPEFQTEAWIAENHPKYLVFTNRLLYSVDNDGIARPLPMPESSPRRPEFAVAYTNRYYYVTCALITSGFLMMNRKLRKQITKNESI